ncbi:MAG: elongation factor P--(R)-beta-lysine ligase [Candidatus Symbiodolus clandestinus]
MWQPTTSITTLQQRASFLATIRAFFAERAILEVETPLMSQASVTDCHLHSFMTHLALPGSDHRLPLYLITSPEYHMKRLLAAGSGPIFQLSRSCRNEEWGRWHNPEFTLLEWYQPGDLTALMEVMDQLLMRLLGCKSAERLSYQQLFQHYLGFDPLTIDLNSLQSIAATQSVSAALQEADRDTLLQLLLTMAIEPQLPKELTLFLYHFPASQAALAKLHPEDPRVAERFEVYYQGVELANGFHELQDPEEQRQRFQKDNWQRQQRGLPQQPIDERLLAALQHGIPDCSGIAVGIDRLLMLALGKTAIQEVIAFSTPVA